MKNRGEIYILLTALIISTFGIFIRELDKEVPPIAQVSLRFMIAAIIYFVLFAKDRAYLKITKPQFFKLLIAGFLAYGVMVVLFVLSYLNTSYANASAFTSMTPLFAGIFGWMLLREKITNSKIIALLLSVSGVMIIFRPDFSNFDIGIAYGIACALLYGLYFTIIRSFKKDDWKTSAFYVPLFAGFLLFPFVLIFETTSFSYSLTTWIYIIIMSLLNVAVLFFLNKGMQTVEAGVGGILSSSVIVFGSIISILVYRELPSLAELAGYAFILLAVVAVHLKFKKGDR